jgi:hypothetical protein
MKPCNYSHYFLSQSDNFLGTYRHHILGIYAPAPFVVVEFAHDFADKKDKIFSYYLQKNAKKLQKDSNGHF